VGTRVYVLKKVVHAALTLAFVLVFNFVLFRVMPSDPVKILTRTSGLELTAEQQRELLRDYGLDKPLFPGQFLDYVGDVLRGDLGVSFLFPGEPVMDVFLRNLWPTVLLVGISTVLSTVIGVLMGIRSGWRRGSAFDLGSMGVSLVLYSMPEFWLGMMLLILFATTLGWFPTGGRISTAAGLSGLEHLADVANHLVLPVLTLTLAYLGEYYLVMRSSLLDVLGEDYITTARAKGLREKLVLRRHAVRNALLPTVTLIALNFGFVLGGAITVEVVFSYQGLGLLTFEALEAKDYPLLQGTFLFLSAAVILANLVADLLYAYLDPRVREA
jgi:peptide/nickel transport system permease protein